MAQNITQYCHVCKSQTTSGPPVDGGAIRWKLHGESARQPHQAFEGAETLQKSCGTRRNDLSPWEGFGRTSGAVSDLNSKTAPLGATKYHKSNDQW